MLTAVVGINWGDEGKGRMVDLLSRDHQIVVRYQGDAASEHTIVANGHRYVFHLLPTGILSPEVVCVMGNGTVIDPEELRREITALWNEGVDITPARLKISDRAAVVLPCHMESSDRYEALPATSVYADKVTNRTVRMGDLLHPDYLAKRLSALPTASVEIILAWAVEYREFFRDFISDTGRYLHAAHRMGMDILFEGSQGALRDVDFGMQPYAASFSTLAAYAPVGAGVPGLKLDRTVGIMKAYSSLVGEGVFVSELFGEQADHLKTVGNRMALPQSDNHRVGAFDAVASRYGARIQGADELALTKLDTLSYMEKIPVCIAYEVDGVRTEELPTGADLEIAQPVFEYVDGWSMSIDECRTADDLPVEALTYVKYIEQLVGVKISYVSVGAEREAYIRL